MKQLLFILFLLCTLQLVAQVQINKQLQMSGSTNADKQITGVGTPSTTDQAVNAGNIQNGALIYSSATGTGDSIAVTLSPVPAAYAAGMVVNFLAAANNTGVTKINVNSLGAKTIKKTVSSDLASGDIKNGQAVSVIYDGSNFQMLSPLGNQSAPVNLDFTLSANPTSVTSGSINASTSATPIILTATAIAGNLSPISVTVSGVPSGASYTLTPNGGYPSPTLTMSLVFNITSLAAGTYPITATATGGITPRTVNLSLTVLSKRVFVTSTTFTGGSIGGLSGADNSCQSLANARSLGGTWKAWLSTSTVNAKDRVLDATYVRMDGLLVASNKADLTDGTLANPIQIDETGANTGSCCGAWTGTNADGTNASSTNCSNWTNTSSSGLIGRQYLSDGNWTSVCCGGVGCSNSVYRIYCFEQ